MDTIAFTIGSWMAYNKGMEFMNSLYYNDEEQKKISKIFRRLKTSKQND